MYATILLPNVYASAVVAGVSIVSLQPPTEIPKGYPFYADYAQTGLNLSDAHHFPYGSAVGH